MPSNHPQLSLIPASPASSLKHCTRCKEIKPRSAFARYRLAKDGLNFWCKACCKEDYNLNYQKRREQQRSYKEKRRATLAEKQRRYYAKNREARLKYGAEWRKQNKDRTRVYGTLYVHRKRSNGDPSNDTIAHSLILKNDPCCFCGSRERIQLDHIVPVTADGTNEWTNLTAACYRCNRAKWAKPLLHFLLDRA